MRWSLIFQPRPFRDSTMSTFQKANQAFLWHIQGHQCHGVLHQWTGQRELFFSVPEISHVICWIFRKAMHVSFTFLEVEDIRKCRLKTRISSLQVGRSQISSSSFPETQTFDVAFWRWTLTVILWFYSCAVWKHMLKSVIKKLLNTLFFKTQEFLLLFNQSRWC